MPQMSFVSYYKENNNYADLSVYHKYCYLRILDLYVDFLLDIYNITRAIKVQRLLVAFNNNMYQKDITRLAFMYSVLENWKDLYQLYLNNDFDAYEYLLLLVVLLKHEEEYKAREVLIEMFDKIEYSTYLSHLWDLDLNDEKQKAFYDVVEDCYSDISSIPDFFSFVASVQESL